jgi:hypothetical protein
MRIGADNAGRSAASDSGASLRVSTWAVASLLVSIAACCPFISSVLAILMGVRALIEIRANPMVKGRNYAIAGIIIGVVTILAWSSGARWWHVHARLPLISGPQAELRRGLGGDVLGFKAGFHGHGALTDDAEAAAFLRHLSTRYGDLVGIEQSDAGRDAPAPTGPAVIRITYLLRFQRCQVQAEAAFVTFGPARVVPDPVFKWKWIRVIDPDRGDLIYPQSASAEALAQPQAASPP